MSAIKLHVRTRICFNPITPTPPPPQALSASFASRCVLWCAFFSLHVCFARVSLCVFDSPRFLKPSIKTLLWIHFDSLLNIIHFSTSLHQEGQRASVSYPYLLLLLPVSCLFAQVRQKLSLETAINVFLNRFFFFFFAALVFIMKHHCSVVPPSNRKRPDLL